MRDELIIIDNLFNEHAAMDGHMQSVCKIMDGWDIEELNVSALADSNQYFNEKSLNLKQTMIDLEEGIKQHQKHEEEILLPIAGEPVIEALKIEHKEMQKQVGEINYLLRNYDSAALLANLDYLKLIVNNLCNLVSSHSAIENGLLNLLKKRFI